MTNQEMVAALDAVIARWQLAREILASIEHGTSDSAPAEPLLTKTVAEPESTPLSVRITVVKPRQRRERQNKVPAPIETALSGTVPSGPIVVSAAEAARLRERAADSMRVPSKHETVSVEPGYSLDDLVREIEQKLQRPVAS